MTANQIAEEIFTCGLAPFSKITEEWIINEINNVQSENDILEQQTAKEIGEMSDDELTNNMFEKKH